VSHTSLFAGRVEFFLAAANIPAAVAALHTAAPDSLIEDTNQGLGDWLAELPADLEPREALTRICDFCDFCGWGPYCGRDGDVVDWYVTDPNSAGFHLDPLFYALAPYVRDGSYVQVTDSEGLDLVYHFRGGTMDYGTKVDPLDHREWGVVVRRELLERVRAYLIASNVAGGRNGSCAGGGAGARNQPDVNGSWHALAHRQKRAGRDVLS
jgi:hypothetical protein